MSAEDLNDKSEDSSTSSTTGKKVGKEIFSVASQEEKSRKADFIEKGAWSKIIGQETDDEPVEKPDVPSLESPDKADEHPDVIDGATESKSAIPVEAGAVEPIEEATPEAAPEPVRLATKEEQKPTAEASVEQEESDEAEDKIESTVGEMSEAEKAKETVLVVDEKVPELEAELGNTQDEAEAAGIKAQIEHLKDRRQAAAETPPDPIDSDPVEADTPTPEAAPEPTPEVEAEVLLETEQAPVPEPEVLPVEPEAPAEFQHEQTIELNTPEQPVQAEQIEADEDDEPQPLQPTPQQQQQANAGQPNPNAPAAANSTANQPPTPPVNPFAPGSPGNPNVPGGPTNVFNTVNFFGANPNTPGTTRIENNYFRRESGAGPFFAGGLLGYMLGRRAGRIKTERLMRKVSKKLEKQIKDVREEVIRQSEVVRQQARDNFNQARQLQQRGAETTAARVLDGTKRPETITELTGGQVATNRQQAAERLSMTPAEASATAERIPRMDTREVLAIAEKANVDGTSLQTIFEAKQITEPGLRRLTQEFLRGGDVKAALGKELQLKEMQYERDPQMRDRLAASYAGVEAAGPQASSEAMAVLIAQGAQPKPYQMHQSVQQAAEAAKASKDRGKKVLVGAWAAVVFVLVIVAIILAARR